MDIVCGIDGGGTKTVLEFRTINNEYICRKVFSAFNINSIGEESFSILSDHIMSEIKAQGNCRSLCIGTAGSSNPLTEKIIRTAAEKIGYTGSLSIVGDHEIAMEGALEEKDGLILIAGTGSICYGRKTGESPARCGGWGHILDDGGSAYAIARDGFSAAVKSYDGRKKADVLQKLLFEALQIKTAEELIPFIYTKMDKAMVASYAGIVIEAAKAGDKTAQEILDQNAMALVDMAVTVIKSCKIEKGTIALLGGVFSNSLDMREKVMSQILLLYPEVCFRTAGSNHEMNDCMKKEICQDAAAGAARLAFKMCSKE